MRPPGPRAEPFGRRRLPPIVHAAGVAMQGGTGGARTSRMSLTSGRSFRSATRPAALAHAKSATRGKAPAADARKLSRSRRVPVTGGGSAWTGHPSRRVRDTWTMRFGSLVPSATRDRRRPPSHDVADAARARYTRGHGAGGHQHGPIRGGEGRCVLAREDARVASLGGTRVLERSDGGEHCSVVSYAVARAGVRRHHLL